ncbi:MULTISPECIES: N-acetylmuramidase family protein [Pandoraea]|uniref:N-acetylmuramidase domain-containing protein n=1 Tax=Pandoraea TaxID=93217 RepID=UPI001F5CE7FF|nr:MULTISPECIES: N-acetylmuramidase family protein [Pandoraea]MCI3205825.1 peptidoglycan-binding protein [Pandoraea sp. LA3]MDN4583853.1 peptidoglycan-binding protein [Pandoraea capi]
MTPLDNVLREGSHGAPVRALQTSLKAFGAPINADGWFGPATTRAVMEVQQHFGLVVDGIAGTKTQQALAAGARAPGHLTAADLAEAAQKLGVELAIVRAVNEVESRGCGFLPDGRPVILYERHIMYREVVAIGLDAPALAQRYPNLVNQARGGYVGGAGEHKRLADASTIHRPSALSSASWGAFQIMAFHWKRLGYESVEAFVDLMRTGEAAQLDAFVRYVLADPTLLKAMKGKKWATVAELFNGKDFAANLYDVKLDRAYDKYAALKVAA